MLEKIAKKIALYILAGTIVCTGYIFLVASSPPNPVSGTTVQEANLKP